MNIYDFTVPDQKGNITDLKKYSGNVLLITNTATKCGFTPQYKELQALFEKFYNKGFFILDFPCNQFGEQAPGTAEEISGFCSVNYGTTFPRFAKINVNGENALPLFKFMQSQKGFAGFNPEHTLTPVLDKLLSKEDPEYKKSDSIKWNFTKFLIDRSGNVVRRFEPTAQISEIEKSIEEII